MKPGLGTQLRHLIDLLHAWLDPFRRTWERHVDKLERHLDARAKAPVPKKTRKPKP